jgi:hypothetical protein
MSDENAARTALTLVVVLISFVVSFVVVGGLTWAASRPDDVTLVELRSELKSKEAETKLWRELAFYALDHMNTSKEKPR